MVCVGPPLFHSPLGSSKGLTLDVVARAGKRAIDRCGLEDRIGRGDGAGVIDGAVAGKERADRGDSSRGLDDSPAPRTAARLAVEGNRGIVDGDGAAIDIKTAGCGSPGRARDTFTACGLPGPLLAAAARCSACPGLGGIAGHRVVGQS